MDPLASSLSHLDVGDDLEIFKKSPSRTFRFFDLPAELRRKVLDLVFSREGVLDIDLRVSKLLQMFPVSRQFYAEAIQSFYGSNMFRLLPTHGRAAWKHAVPLIKCFPDHCRAEITFLEFRLGPFWTDPPRCWYINDSVGLEDCENLRLLRVFVEIDPSHAVFNGFRNARLSYTDLAGGLLESMLERLPSVEGVQIDGAPSVRGLPLVTRLAQVTLDFELRLSWGPGLLDNSRRSVTRKIDVQGMVPFYCTPLHHIASDGDSAFDSSVAAMWEHDPAFVGKTIDKGDPDIGSSSTAMHKYLAASLDETFG